MSKQQAKAQDPKQPMFYSKPTPLIAERHAEAGISSEVNYAFSAQTNSVPITIPEFVEIAKSYPIVFTGDETAEPAAVLGLENNKNLFVNSEGDWVKDKYIPVYIRRYPFAFMMHEDKLILCVDEDAPHFTKHAKKKDLKFFEGTEQTKTTKFALEFCLQFHKDHLTTHNFSKALNDTGLLKVQQLTATFKDKKESRTLAGFKIVDEEALRNLSADKLQELNKNGFLGLIFIHLMSLSNFSKITSMVKTD